jgi:hypothetical protein
MAAPFGNPLNGVLHKCGLANAATSDGLGAVCVGGASSAVLSPPEATLGAGIDILAHATMRDFMHSVERAIKGLTVIWVLPGTHTKNGAVVVLDRVVLMKIQKGEDRK